MLVALGITLIYGLTRLVNFAHGQMLVLGGFISYLLGSEHWPFYAAVLMAMLIVGLFGELLDLGVFRRTLGSPLNGFIVSLGLISICQASFALRFGNSYYSIQAPLRGIWQLGGVRFDQPRLVIIAAATAACAVLFALLERTDWGRATRALAENGMAARALGVPVGRLISATFFIGSALAALGGALFGTVFPFTAYSGSDFILKGFAVAIIGGLGNVIGAVVASLILAVAETFGAGYLSIQWVSAYGLVLMAAILIWRPTGLFRGTESGSDEAFGANWATPGKSAGSSVIPQRVKWILTPLNVVLVCVFVLPAMLSTARSLVVATTAVVTAIIAYSLWITFHHAGMFSIVQGALAGTGAYTAAVLATEHGVSFWLQLPCAVGASAAVACLMGLVSMRATASYFLILTFALSELVIAVLTNWQSVTHGPLGIVTAGPPDALGPIHLRTPLGMYYMAAIFLLVTTAVTYCVGRSRFGRRLHTIRDNERLARSLGLNTYAHKVAIFTIGGAIAGLGGWLYFYQDLYIEPSQFSSLAGIQIALVVILGGIRSPAGPVVGAFLIGFLPEVLQLGPNQSQIAFGVILILLVLVLPGGILGGMPAWLRSMRWPSRIEREASRADAV